MSRPSYEENKTKETNVLTAVNHYCKPIEKDLKCHPFQINIQKVSQSLHILIKDNK